MATPKIDAYFEETRATELRAEDKARHIGNTPELLHELFLDTLMLCKDTIRKEFKGARFDFERRALIGKNMAMYWRLRENPDKPEGLHNQQTSLGLIAFYRVADEWSLHR